MINRTGSATTHGLGKGGVAELRDSVRSNLSKISTQKQVGHQQSTRLGAALQVRQGPRQTVPFQAGSSAGIKQNVTTGAGRGLPKGSRAVAASSNLSSFPIKILDNLVDRTCAFNEPFYMHNSLTTEQIAICMNAWLNGLLVSNDAPIIPSPDNFESTG